MKIGYARVSTKEQNLSLQMDALEKEGCKQIFQEKISGAKADRPELRKMIDQLREGDIIVTWKLDRWADLFATWSTWSMRFRIREQGLNRSMMLSIPLPHRVS
jgi:DNA invertase Pin-like site-specific DNA recombinase